MDALFPRAGLPFQLLGSIACDPRAQDLSVEVTKIRVIDLVLTVTPADTIKLVRDMVRQLQPRGSFRPLARALRRGILPGARPLADYPIYNLP